MKDVADSRDRLVILLGAGSSYDCASGDSASVASDLRPPLVKELFAHRNSFNEILRRYPGAEARADEIRVRVLGGEPFERLLRRMVAEPSLELRRATWQIPLYLQELLGQISSNYITAGATKFETMIAAVMRSAFREVMILTVNYDLFVERAIDRLMRKRFTDINSYVWTCDESRWALVKLHGSVTWGRRLKPTMTMNSWYQVLSELAELNLDEHIRILGSYTDGARYVEGEFYYPALSLPVEGKTEFVCPKEHLAYAEIFVREATHMLAIGFSGLDQHVLDRLVSRMGQIAKLWIVCGTSDYASATSAKLISVNDKLNITGSVYDFGFTRFVDSGDLFKFLGVD